MTEAKTNNILDLNTLGDFTVNLDDGAFTGGGGLTPEGLYGFAVTKLGWTQGKDNTKSLAVTIKLDGQDREVYDYVSLPAPGHEYAAQKSKEFNTFLLSIGVVTEGQTGALNVNGQQIAAAVLNKRGVAYYIPPEQDDKGKIVEGSRQEVTYLTADRAAKVQSGEAKITRRRKAAPANSLGGASTAAPAAAAATFGGGGAPAATFGAPTQPTGFGGGGPVPGGAAVPQPTQAPSLGGLGLGR